LYNYWIDNPNKIGNSREGDKLYYIGDVVTSTSTIIPSGKTWVEWKTTEGKYVAFRKQKGEEHEHLHPSEWTSTHRKNETYRANLDVDPWIGMHLSSMLINTKTPLDIRSLFNNDAAWDYTDRWMTDGFKTEKYANSDKTYYEVVGAPYANSYGSSAIQWIDAMWEVYR
jgi:hypothetical protein